MSGPKLRIISRDNGVGLSRDLKLIAEALDPLPSQVVGFGGNRSANLLREARLWARRGLQGRTHTQIFSERVYPRCLPLGDRNLLVPNPEWFKPKWHRYLYDFDKVLCKTRHAETIFHRLGCDTHYIGFTSDDRYQPWVPRRRAFFHLAGRSSAKGTGVLLDTWLKHPEWPLLTVVQHPKCAKSLVAAANIDHQIQYMNDGSLQELQNSHMFHLCPSETEGFGHYVMEALSVGAVTITTDAEPMNELVAPERGILIPPVSSCRRRLATYYQVDAGGIENAVEQAMRLSTERFWQISRAARRFYQASNDQFRTRLCDALLDEAIEPLSKRMNPVESQGLDSVGLYRA